MSDNNDTSISRKDFIKISSFGMAGLAMVPRPFLYGNRPDYEADIIVYGGTSAAVTAAVQASRMGHSVIMVSPARHLGGLTSNGLGFTDTGDKRVIGGLSREFYHRIYQHYQQSGVWKWQDKSEFGNRGQGTPAIDGDARTMWIFEPHAAEEVFEDFIDEHQIEVHRDEWLDRDSGVEVRNGHITAIKTLSGNIYKGKMFIDATYEGDLMAAAGVSYFVGREANDVYGETWDGVQTGVFQHAHHFKSDIDPYKVPGYPSSGLLPRISPDDPGKKGQGDHKIQAYNFRMCLTKNSDNKVPFPRPEGYDPKQYELLVRVYDSGWRETFHKFDAIPNAKTDTNNHGPFNTDNIGMNYEYPEGSYEKRKQIVRDHETYQKGLMYFIAHDPRIPSEVQQEMKQWGLAADEFTDNGNWPHKIYVREARRMIGNGVMTENEIMGKRPVPKPVGMGSYTMDSHNVQRYVKEDGFVQNEGDIGVAPPEPYHIAYDSLIPQKNEMQNLLVPVCMSSSHIAYGSIRMEPVFMILGQSTATAASLAIQSGKAVQDIDYEKMKKQLIRDKQVLAIS